MTNDDVDNASDAETGAGAPPTGDSEAQSFTLGGTVVAVIQGAAEPLAGATVVVKDGSGAVETTETDAQGHYQFASLAQGQWTVVAWHESYATGPDKTVALTADRDDVDFDLTEGIPGFQLGGSAVWQGRGAAVDNAQVKAVYQSGRAGTPSIRWARTDEHGDFRFSTPMHPGVWELYVLHENGRPYPFRYALMNNKPDLSLTLWPSAGTEDQRAGIWFLVSMVIGLILVTILYVAMTIYSVPDIPGEVDLMLDQIELAESQLKVTASGTVAETVRAGENEVTSVAISNSVPTIVTTWHVISDTNTTMTPEQKTLVAATVAGMEDAAARSQSDEIVAYLNNLTTLLEPASSRNTWADDPVRLRDIVFWALAGVMVNLIVTSGSYLRRHQFYREGIHLHVAQLFTAPIVVVVLVFLLSTVTFTLAVGGAGNLTLDLSDPRILAAVSFLLGVLPWGSWDALRKAAGRLTGQVSDS